MFDLPPYSNLPSGPFAPLLAWDIAHPRLLNQTRMAEDIMQLTKMKRANDWQLNLNFKKLLGAANTIVVTNLQQEIRWASHSFLQMTGYRPDEVLGQKPSLLQGPETDQEKVRSIRKKLADFQYVKACLLNYRKNGESYWCQISIYPVQNAAGRFTHFLAIEKEVDEF